MGVPTHTEAGDALLEATEVQEVLALLHVLDNPQQRFDSINAIQYAVRVDYGPDVFRRFFHLCVQAGRKGEIDFTPGRHLTKDEIIRYMSRAAGEDVGPIYRQWRGFANVP